ncbi:polyprenyl synthetase family protein [Gynuella sp.]|uniref:polyprenyl synthetase family protein n=1 Tax=Gynuella sp. TaxID=2969146 RepID=UPI003D0CC6AF
MSSFEAILEAFKTSFEPSLRDVIGTLPQGAERLEEATVYSLMAGGKRLRSILVKAGARAAGCEQQSWLTPAIAVELVHTYSLIHDDLPAMDDDHLRRGQPTCHVAFDEATAILAADGLQAAAFDCLANREDASLSNRQRLHMVALLARASGLYGMVAGQAIDEASSGKIITLAQLEKMHRLKTGALIKASLGLGCLCTESPESPVYQQLLSIGELLGLAFQVVDDILDVEGDTHTLGKPQGSDLHHNKNTYPSLMGLDAAKDYARTLKERVDGQIARLEGVGDVELLKQITEYVLIRDH